MNRWYWFLAAYLIIGAALGNWMKNILGLAGSVALVIALGIPALFLFVKATKKERPY